MKHALFQVFVEQAGTAIPVGPRLTRDGCERFVMAINRKIIEGVEKRWTNPHIAPVF
jgi:hypothetical protein